MKRKDSKALYRAFHEIHTMCLETHEKMEQNETDYEYHEMMRWRLEGLLDARTILHHMLISKDKK